MVSLMEYNNLLRLIFTYLHTDIITTPILPKFECCDVDFYFCQQVMNSIHPNFLKKYVLYRLPDRYHIHVEIESPFIRGNTYLPGTLFYRVNMFSDLIPLVLSLLRKTKLKSLNTYRKILLRRFMQLQDSAFNYWNQFFEIIKHPLFRNVDNYKIRNQIDKYFIDRFIEGVSQSRKLSFYLNYTGGDIRSARLL